MVDKQKKSLENLPSEEPDRLKLDDCKALKEDLKKVRGYWYNALMFFFCLSILLKKIVPD